MSTVTSLEHSIFYNKESVTTWVPGKNILYKLLAYEMAGSNLEF